MKHSATTCGQTTLGASQPGVVLSRVLIFDTKNSALCDYINPSAKPVRQLFAHANLINWIFEARKLAAGRIQSRQLMIAVHFATSFLGSCNAHCSSSYCWQQRQVGALETTPNGQINGSWRPIAIGSTGKLDKWRQTFDMNHDRAWGSCSAALSLLAPSARMFASR